MKHRVPTRRARVWRLLRPVRDAVPLTVFGATTLLAAWAVLLVLGRHRWPAPMRTFVVIHGAALLLVSHGAALRSIVAHALQASLPQMQRIAIGGNTAISVLRVSDGRMRLVSYNDTAHLDGGASFRVANAEGEQSSGGTQ